MLCHSKVWSRVWTHRCNVNMNPYISVCPLSVCISYPSCSFPESFLSCQLISPLFFYLCSAFISGLLDRHFRGEVMSLHSIQSSCLPRFVLTFHSRHLILFTFMPPFLSQYLLWSFCPLHFCKSRIFKKLVIFPGHWDVWEELYLLFIPYSCEANKPELVFLKDSLLH